MKITVFTPTYNRAYILPRTYESLKAQTNKNFVWVIMDDGSSDNTQDLVRMWIDEGIIEISYHKQNNQGRFVAFNNARPFFVGELVAFLDSDDSYMPCCIENIISCWEKEQRKEKYGGILAHMKTHNDVLIGTVFPENIYSEKIGVLYDKYRVQGDKLIVLRKDLAQKYAYPVFDGEKFGGDGIVFNKVSDECPMILLNEILVFREYLPDSITNNLLQHHLKSKNGMREHYLDCLSHEKYNKRNILKHYIGYISFAKLTNWSFREIQKKSPNKLISLIIFPIASIYYRKLKREYIKMQS